MPPKSPGSHQESPTPGVQARVRAASAHHRLHRQEDGGRPGRPRDGAADGRAARIPAKSGLVLSLVAVQVLGQPAIQALQCFDHIPVHVVVALKFKHPLFEPEDRPCEELGAKDRRVRPFNLGPNFIENGIVALSHAVHDKPKWLPCGKYR